MGSSWWNHSNPRRNGLHEGMTVLMISYLAFYFVIFPWLSSFQAYGNTLIIENIKLSFEKYLCCYIYLGIIFYLVNDLTKTTIENYVKSFEWNIHWILFSKFWIGIENVSDSIETDILVIKRFYCIKKEKRKKLPHLLYRFLFLGYWHRACNERSSYFPNLRRNKWYFEIVCRIDWSSGTC